jgi:hypothetical protein
VELGLSSRPAGANTDLASDRPSGVDGPNLHLGGRRRNGQTGDVRVPLANLATRIAIVGLTGAGLAACASGPLALEAPEVATATARTPTPVDLEPIAAGTAIAGDFSPPGPASVLTAAMSSELRGRALHGGEAGGYSVRCTLDRFAMRTRESVTESREFLALYADLSCEASRATDHAPVWRGELRARTFSEAANVLGSDTGTRQRLLGRALSDAARELASDLALRALGLLAEPSARVFADAEQEHARAGLDDSPFGATALQQTGAGSASLQRAIADTSASVRAAAWNALAMSAGPGDPWGTGAKLTLDDDVAVRFAQYKALARLGSDAALEQLRVAARSEGDPLLAELLADALKTGGTGMARSRR